VVVVGVIEKLLGFVETLGKGCSAHYKSNMTEAEACYFLGDGQWDNKIGNNWSITK
jgi:hypothetical protein